ncbi:L-threonylcarbamoyladenylate synthase [Planctomycetes bacterium K23_9]|uniref:Threonylcarbamoyl-AMP synthase n=1 Tax=Stieleria marina TaxID=1930275 RepID=A0A517NZI5_9BACT|nr:Threonylcarbamoyl-AMP synthase [Planctomycetes bacterium K23_9]
MVTQQEISDAANLIRRGGLVAFPTETVYGLGANALNADAVAKIFELKGRPRFDPLIVHIADVDQLVDLAKVIPPAAAELIERFWPGPLSLVLPKHSSVPDIVTSGLPSVAIRCPDHDVARTFIRATGVPISAPSANRFGMISPTTAAHVRQQFGDQLPTVLDDGPCRIGVESTVVSFVESSDHRPTLLRPGGVTLEEIQAVIGTIDIKAQSEGNPNAPGQLASHYAPTTPLTLVASDWVMDDSIENQKVGLLSFQTHSAAAHFAAVEVLSAKGCLREAAVNLFAALRRLDEMGLDSIIAMPVPEAELGRAIMDRLRRAAAK